jgi:putative oxidoreductase
MIDSRSALPAALAYLTFWAELLGGLALVAGVGARWVAIALVPILIGATWVHAGNGWVFSAPNGGWEYPVFLIVASLVQALLGEGRFALASLLPAPNFRLRMQS